MKFTTTAERIEILKKLGVIEIISNLPESRLLANIEQDNNYFYAIFISRNYDWNTVEYKATLLLECLYGAKSLDMQQAKYYADRFDYVVSKY